MTWHTLPDARLTNDRVTLRRIALTDYEQLARIAFDERIWEHFVTRVATPEDLTRFVESALVDTLTRTRIVFAIVDRATGGVVGSTAYGNLAETERRLEIGWSWVAVGARRTGVNRAAKLALLDHAFGALQCERVEFKTDVLNTRARQALLGIGAREEGVLRSFNYMPGGRRRDVVYFSILRDEWPEVRGMRFSAAVSGHG